ncbi:xanthine dehydrogenase [Geobacillus subterraneus]|uniref:Xanthine dehydrogenase n=2 Tax=Geobacillus TaxID=129337 RepID=A0ABM6AE30_9BACL|nr:MULTISPECIES: XdhC/CoxI family protein [Geobacillus]AMX84618.1 xanthine dehydrogenase [Geobacillus subterraneus]KZS24820.1 xanthine dehydrogenase [Geobacillus subterraneus]OXB85440.1 xanthine dehydrogenase [Geobacillus uzenensis]
MESYYAALDAMAAAPNDGVFAITIDVEGSAYQKEGTWMWIGADGKTTGLLSGGCLEEAVAAHAIEVLSSRQAAALSFDLRAEDDGGWGQGSGCDGVIHVWLEPVTNETKPDWLTLKQRLDRGEHVLMARSIAHPKEPPFFQSETGERFGGYVSPPRPEWLNALHGTPFFHGRNRVQETDSGAFYIQHFWPKPRLVIFGAGPDAPPLVSAAKAAGFSVTISDWRPAFCHPSHIPDADAWVVGFPHETVPTLHLTERDFVIIMTHQFERDRELVQWLADMPLAYLGVLGPRRRTDRLFPSGSAPPFVRSPVGLPIGAHSPQEIAISILAELISVLRAQPMEAAR